MNDAVRQNLIDAGCNKRFITEFEANFDDKKKCEHLLAIHRKELLKKFIKKSSRSAVLIISCIL